MATAAGPPCSCTAHPGTRARIAGPCRRGAPSSLSLCPRSRHRCPPGFGDGGAAPAGPSPGDFLQGLPEARPGLRYQNHPDQTLLGGERGRGADAHPARPHQPRFQRLHGLPLALGRERAQRDPQPRWRRQYRRPVSPAGAPRGSGQSPRRGRGEGGEPGERRPAPAPEGEYRRAGRAGRAPKGRLLGARASRASARTFKVKSLPATARAPRERAGGGAERVAALPPQKKHSRHRKKPFVLSLLALGVLCPVLGSSYERDELLQWASIGQQG